MPLPNIHLNMYLFQSLQGLILTQFVYVRVNLDLPFQSLQGLILTKIASIGLVKRDYVFQSLQGLILTAFGAGKFGKANRSFNPSKG